MKVAAKKDQPQMSECVFYGPSVTTVRQRIQRAVRKQRRAVSKVFGTETDGPNTVCSICQEPFDDEMDVEITACGHAFHSACSHEYRKNKVVDEMDSFRSQSLAAGLSKNTQSLGLAKILVRYDVGFDCPNCRCPTPLIHEMAKRTCAKPRQYCIGTMQVTLSPTDFLAFVTKY